MKVRQSARARYDLENIYEFGEIRYGDAAARQYIEDIVVQYRFLSDWPFASPAFSDVRPAVRIRTFKGHIIVYRVGEEEIEIVRVLSRFQNWRDHI
jgi:toxin ParE1/3/4